MKGSNKGVQGTLHKVSGPLTPDVRVMRMKYITAILLLSILMLTGCAPKMDDVRSYGEDQFIADVLSVTNGTPAPDRLITEFHAIRIEPHLGGAWVVTKESSDSVTGIYVDSHSVRCWGGSGMELTIWSENIALSKEKKRKQPEQGGPAYPPQGIGSADP